jgi:hypothetical protein
MHCHRNSVTVILNRDQCNCGKTATANNRTKFNVIRKTPICCFLLQVLLKKLGSFILTSKYLEMKYATIIEINIHTRKSIFIFWVPVTVNKLSF